MIVIAVTAGILPAVEAQTPTIGDRVDDAAITAALKTKLVADRISVNVDTQQGIVHLKGAVPTERDRMEAERLARGTKAASPRTR